MSEKKKVKINGFVFTDEAEAEQAKKEAHGIHYVEDRADMHHPKAPDARQAAGRASVR